MSRSLFQKYALATLIIAALAAATLIVATALRSRSSGCESRNCGGAEQRSHGNDAAPCSGNGRKRAQLIRCAHAMNSTRNNSMTKA